MTPVPYLFNSPSGVVILVLHQVAFAMSFNTLWFQVIEFIIICPIAKGKFKIITRGKIVPVTSFLVDLRLVPIHDNWKQGVILTSRNFLSCFSLIFPFTAGS